MPVREFGCEGCHKIEEHFRHRVDDMTAPECCGKPMRQLISRFGIVWTGHISKYNDPTKDRTNQTEDGSHWVWRVRSSRSGHPERIRLTSIAEQKAYCKEEGLILPSDCNPNADISSDGHKLSSQGMPGCWC
jgi:predicted nucleic acid-binding Zn ribbon protein